MCAEINAESMDRMIEELEKREVMKPDRLTPRRAIREYYPRLKALADAKGYRVKDLYKLFLELNPNAGISEKTFILYWYRARRDHAAMGTVPLQVNLAQTGKLTQAAESIISESEKAVNPGHTSIDEAQAEKPAHELVADSGKPEKPVHASEKEETSRVQSKSVAHTAVKSGAAVQPQTSKSGFLAEADIKAKDELLIKRCGGNKP